MDPLSITAGCISLLSGISKLTVDISSFVSSFRDARKDMDAVSRELTSLSLCVQALRDDSRQITYPDGLRDNMLAVLKNCEAVTGEITATLHRFSSANAVRRVQWSATGKWEINRLRSSLESHKSALDIAIDMTSLVLISGVKDDTAQIRQDTSQIDMLVQQIEDLRIQLGASPLQDTRAQLLQRFLDSSTTYAETVLDPTEVASIRQDSPQADVPVTGKKHSLPATVNIGANLERGEEKPTFYCLPPDFSSPRLYQPTARQQRSIDEATLRRNGLNLREQNRLDQKLHIAIMGREERWWMPSGRKTLVEIEKLLDQGADPTAVKGYNPGPLDEWDKFLLSRGVICFRDVTRFSWDAVVIDEKFTEYLENGARVAANQAEEVLVNAISRGQKPLVRLFLDAGVFPDTSKPGSSLGICVACEEGYPEIVKMLLRAGSRCENEALHTAIDCGNEEILDILLDHGALATSRVKGQTALETAFRVGNLRIMKTLLNRGAIVFDDVFELTKVRVWRTYTSRSIYRYGKRIEFKLNGTQSEAVALLTKYYNEQKAAGVKLEYW